MIARFLAVFLALSFASARTLFAQASEISTWSATLTSTTNGAGLNSPLVTIGSATAITSTSATLNGTVNPRGLFTTAYFEYGVTTAYGSTTAMSSSGGNVAEPFGRSATGLLPATTYHLRLVAWNADGITRSADQTVTTLPLQLTAPFVSTEEASNVTANSVTFAGVVNPNNGETTARFEYGYSANLGLTTPTFIVGAGSTPSFWTRTVTGLLSNAPIYYRIVATNPAGSATGVTKFARTNVSPVAFAGDDVAFTARREGVRIDVLANDGGAPRSQLRVTFATQPSAGAVQLNADGSVNYYPGNSFRGIDVFSYTMAIADSNATATATVTILDTYTACAGLYSALIGKETSQFRESGVITIRVSAQGAFTGSLQLAAKRYPLSGFLRGDGQASINVPTAAGSFSLTFTIDPATQHLTGAVIAQTISTFTVAKVPYDGTSNPAPQAGRYTVMMSPIYTYSLSGNGYGPATMTVGAAGLVRVTGWTPQGNPFVSTPAYVGADGKFPFYAVQVSPRLASVQGIIHFAAQPGVADCSGNVGLAVMSPPNDPVANFAMTFLGSTYTVPAANELLLPWEDTQGIGNLEIGWPATGTSLTQVALNQRHRVTATPARIARIILNPKSGTFTGSLELRLAAGLRRATARGIVFQAQGIAAGRWNVLGVGGAMRLIPVAPEIPDDRNPVGGVLSVSGSVP